MSVIYLDTDALQLARNQLQPVLEEARVQAGNQSWRAQNLESTFVGLRSQAFTALNPIQNPSHLWNVWETSGLAGMAADYVATYGAHEALLGATNVAIEQLCAAHADAISAYFCAQGDPITRPFGQAMNDLSEISGIFHLDNLLMLIENPWRLIALCQDAHGALGAAANALEGFIANLGRVLAHEEAVIANMVSQLTTIQEVRATSSPFPQSVQNDLRSGKLTSHDLAGGANTGYQRDKGALPISISRGVDQNGKPVILVMIAGVDKKAPSQANNFIYAVLAGFVASTGLGAFLDPYALEVEADIRTYEQQQGLGAGTTVDIAGHSYGGIVAQELSSDQWLLGFNVAPVVTFGAPPNWLSSSPYRYSTLYDAVPLASLDTLSPVGLGVLALGGVAAGAAGTPMGGLTADAYAFGKQIFTGEQVVSGGNNPNPKAWFLQDHQWSYANSRDPLMKTKVPFIINNLGATDYFSAPPIP